MLQRRSFVAVLAGVAAAAAFNSRAEAAPAAKACAEPIADAAPGPDQVGAVMSGAPVEMQRRGGGGRGFRGGGFRRVGGFRGGGFRGQRFIGPRRRVVIVGRRRWVRPGVRVIGPGPFCPPGFFRRCFWNGWRTVCRCLPGW